MTDTTERFDALLEAMVTKPPLTDVSAEQEPDGEPDLREDDGG